ncbi:hypothetical protein KCP71_25455 [Salmonella enterica subsp. enterica]|nr:hypothetical protein KCP71_25455 [Salmonella enterica subsp. enterica]
MLGTQARGLCELPGLEKLADAPQFNTFSAKYVMSARCLPAYGERMSSRRKGSSAQIIMMCPPTCGAK